MGPPGRQNRVDALTQGYPEPDEEYMAPVLDQDDMESHFLEDSKDVYLGEWDDYYEHLPEDQEYYEPIKQPKMNVLACFTRRKAVKTLPAASHGPEPEVGPNGQFVDTGEPSGDVAIESLENKQTTSVLQTSVATDSMNPAQELPVPLDPEAQLVEVEETNIADPVVQITRDVLPPNTVVHTGTMITPEVISPEDADAAAYIIPPPPEFTDFLEHADVADYITPPPPEFTDFLEHADVADYIIPPPLEFADSLEHTDVGDDILPPPPEFIDSLEYADVRDEILALQPEFTDFSETADIMHDPSVAQTADRLLETATDNDCLPQHERLVQSKPCVTGTKDVSEPVNKTTADPNAVENCVIETINPAISAVEQCTVDSTIPGPSQPPRKEQKVASTLSRSTKPRDLTVEVQLNGKTTRFLVDTGAAVSVMDAQHLQDLYNGQPPPLDRSASRALKTVSGEDLPVRWILHTTINIAGGNYPCEFKVIEGVTYRGVLGHDFLCANCADISFATNTLQLKGQSPVTVSEDLLTVVAPATYIVLPRSETIITAIRGTLQSQAEIADQFTDVIISEALPPETEIVDQAWKQAPPVNLMPTEGTCIPGTDSTAGYNQTYSRAER